MNDYITLEYVKSNGKTGTVGPKKNSSLCQDSYCWFNNKAGYIQALSISYEANNHEGFKCPLIWLTNVN